MVEAVEAVESVVVAVVARIRDLAHARTRALARAVRRCGGGKASGAMLGALIAAASVVDGGRAHAGPGGAGRPEARPFGGLLRKKVSTSRFVNLTSPTQTQLKRLWLTRPTLMCWSTMPVSKSREQ